MATAKLFSQNAAPAFDVFKPVGLQVFARVGLEEKEKEKEKNASKSFSGYNHAVVPLKPVKSVNGQLTLSERRLPADLEMSILTLLVPDLTCRTG